MAIHLALAITLINTAGVRAANVLLVLYALEFGAQPVAIGLLAATFSVFPIMVSVPSGKFADRYGSRWLLVFGSVIAAIGMLIPNFAPGLPAIFVAASLVGFLDGIFVVSLQNLVGLLSTEQTRAHNFSRYSLTTSFAGLIAPLFVGFSIDHSGHASASLYLALFIMLPLPLLVIAGGVLPGGTRQRLASGSSIRTLLSEPGIISMLGASGLHISGNTLYQFYMPVYTHAIGLSASAIGSVLAVNAAAEISVRVILPRLISRFSQGNVLAYSLYAGAVSLILIPFFEHAVVLALISFMFGFAMGGAGPIITMLMFGNAPRGRSGEAMGLRMTVNFATKMISPVMFGSIASAIGLVHIFWINSLMLGTAGRLSRMTNHQATGNAR